MTSPSPVWPWRSGTRRARLNRDAQILPPNLLDSLDSVLALLRLPRLGLMVDFDGTISEIAPTPDEATVSVACAEALQRLAHRMALVAIISGRSAADLSEKVALDAVRYVGNHGAEYVVDGRLSIAPGAAEYQDRVKAVFDHLKATANEPGLYWQDKGLGASIHYRLAPDPDRVVGALTDALSSAPGAEGLEVFWGKLVLELRAPIGLDKGYAVRKLVDELNLDGAIVIGDDATDRDAMVALRDLGSQGAVAGMAVAVVHSDMPAALLEAAHYTLEGVPQVETFLKWLDEASTL